MEEKTVTHLVAGLGLGGAETMLFQLLSHRRDLSIRHRVISLGAESYYEQPIRDLGIDLIVVPFKRSPIASLKRIKNILASTDTLCCWMYYGNLIGELAARSLHKKKRIKIIWNVRHSNLDKGNVKTIIRGVNRLCALFSNNVDVIAYNGELARSVHEAMGYNSEKSVVLDNGCDIKQYYPREDAIFTLRDELGISEEKQIILSVAKDDPIKDLPTFISAFSIVHRNVPSTIAVMCGRGVEKDNEKLNDLFRKSNLTVGEDVYLLGLRTDVPLLLSGCNVYVLHSAGEAFPNTLIQAMACECLCVTTDVGDARRILGDESLTVSPKAPQKLADKIIIALSLPPEEQERKKKANRKAIIEKYDINVIVQQYEALF